MGLVETFVRLPGEEEILSIKYPGATVLLDLTANEQCIEKVAQMMKERGLYDVIVRELEISMARKVPKGCPEKIQYNRYRDLMIGIILNLTCNVESQELTEYIVLQKDVLRLL